MGACGVVWWHEYSLKESPQMDRFATFPGFKDGLYLIRFCGTDWNDGVVGIGEAHQSSARLHQKQLSLGGDVWDNGGFSYQKCRPWWSMMNLGWHYNSMASPIGWWWLFGWCFNPGTFAGTPTHILMFVFFLPAILIGDELIKFIYWIYWWWCAIAVPDGDPKSKW